MAYDNAIPQATDLISQSQAQILENFRQLDLQYGTSAASDHVAFTAAANPGTHKQVSFSSEPSLPFPAVSEHSFLYERLTGAVPQISYLEYQSSGSSEIAPISPKVFCVFNSNLVVAPFMNIVSSFNVNSATTSRTGSTFTIGFTKALPNANYLVQLTRGGTPGTIFYSGKTTSSISITVNPIAGTDEFILVVM